MKTLLRLAASQRYSKLKFSEQGFTLVELLVVIIIIGVLSSIALPSFLRLINLAKSTEGKTTISSVSKKQEAFYTEHNRFTSSFPDLGADIKTETENYSFFVFVDNTTFNGAIHVAQSKQKFVESYLQIMYWKNNQLQKCSPVSVDLSFPAGVIFQAVANPKQFCP